MAFEATAEAIHRRLPDGGPVYVETPNTYPPPHLIAEPWNAATAALFVVVALWWIVRLKGRYRQFPLLCLCIPILLTGGIGGTLFHALRISRIFLLMDWVPITVLGLVCSLYLWFRLGPKIQYVIGMTVFVGLLQLTGQAILPTHWAINLSYASLAVLVLAPLALMLIRTRFRHVGLAVTALVCFGIAWLCRLADAFLRPPLLPMGTHWLWHLFGVGCTLAIGEYFYRLEQEPVPTMGAEQSAEAPDTVSGP